MIYWLTNYKILDKINNNKFNKSNKFNKNKNPHSNQKLKNQKYSNKQ